MTIVNIDRQDTVATVTLNRPEAMNALSGAMMVAITEALAQVDADPAIRAIVITGAGERAFCAGLDLKEVGTHGLSLSPTGVRAANAIHAPEACKTPIIAAINGVAITGGLELAMGCDILIASTKARFADTHARVGVLAGGGASQRLSRAIGLYRAKEMSLTGNFIDAQTALAWGLVNRVVEPDQLLPAAQALAADIASIDPVMIANYKALIDDGFGLAFEAGMALERERAGAQNQAVTPEAVEARRLGVLARGRTQ
jgi:enoyl-CoA hydratase